jgi:hypothetical protein
MNVGVRVERAPASPIAVLHLTVQRSDLSRVVPASMGEAWKMLREAGVRGGQNVAVYLDGAITLEVGVEIDGPVPDNGRLLASETPTRR